MSRAPVTLGIEPSRRQINNTVKLTKTDERTIRTILASCTYSPLADSASNLRYSDKLHNCDVMIREDVSMMRVLLSFHFC